MANDTIREFTGPAGRLEALLEPPVLAPGQRVRAAVVFAHPLPIEGGTMHTKAVFRATKALARIGCACGDAQRRLPACVQCHGASLTGVLPAKVIDGILA